MSNRSLSRLLSKPRWPTRWRAGANRAWRGFDCLQRYRDDPTRFVLGGGLSGRSDAQAQHRQTRPLRGLAGHGGVRDGRAAHEREVHTGRTGPTKRMTMGFEFATAGRVIFGGGTSCQAGALARKVGKRALVVTGRRGGARRIFCWRRCGRTGVRSAVFAVAGEPKY